MDKGLVLLILSWGFSAFMFIGCWWNCCRIVPPFSRICTFSTLSTFWVFGIAFSPVDYWELLFTSLPCSLPIAIYLFRKRHWFPTSIQVQRTRHFAKSFALSTVCFAWFVGGSLFVTSGINALPFSTAMKVDAHVVSTYQSPVQKWGNIIVQDWRNPNSTIKIRGSRGTTRYINNHPDRPVTLTVASGILGFPIIKGIKYR